MLGILGGMGPEATVDLYRAVISLTPALRDQDHIPTIILSNPETPDRTQSVLQGSHKSLPYLIEGVTFLEHAGADFIVIPCNTAHCYIDDLRQGVKIPILSIIEETVKSISKSQPLPVCVGILATDGTRTMNLYGDLLSQSGLRYLYPDATHQAQVMQAVYHIKSGYPPGEKVDALQESARHLKSAGAEALILGCTELPILAKDCDLGLPIYNPTQILAAAAVAYALSP